MNLLDTDHLIVWVSLAARDILTGTKEMPRFPVLLDTGMKRHLAEREARAILTPEGSEKLAGGRASARPPVAREPEATTPKGSKNVAATKRFDSLGNEHSSTPSGSVRITRFPVVSLALDHRLILRPLRGQDGQGLSS